MPFLIVQSSTTPPTPAQLEAGFSRVPGVTVQDARHIARRQPIGVVVEGLEEEVAKNLAVALTDSGANVVAINEADLPVLPAPMHVASLEFAETQLRLFNIMNRPTTIAWDRLTLLAAGRIPYREVRRNINPVINSMGGNAMAPVAEWTSIYSDLAPTGPGLEGYRLVMLIVGNEGQTVQEIDAQRFNYNCLGDRIGPHFQANFLTIIRDLMAAAPSTLLNQGAAWLAQPEASELMIYPTRRIFDREAQWLHWWVKQGT